jgi:hypothetical protein
MIARKDSFRQEGMNGNSNSGSPPVNWLVEESGETPGQFRVRGKGKQKESLSAEQSAFEKILSLQFVYRSADQVGVSFISEETEGRDSLAVGSSRRGRKLC